MMKKYIYIIGVGVCSFLSGCSNDMLQPDSGEERAPIIFNASGITVSTEGQTMTKATDNEFPNSGEIAIVAANATSATADWSSIYMDHVAATAADKADGKHAVTPATVYYWPFNPDEYLSFVAYSPRIGETVTAVSGNETKLRIAGPGSSTDYTYPDLLCTAVVGPCNKTHGEVALPFSHVMAQVEINVIAIDKDGNEITNPGISITNLSLKTKVAGGTFDLSSNAWALDDAAGNYPANSFHTFINSSTAIPKKNMSCLLLPGTEGNVQVSITVTDASGGPITKTATINEFKTGTDPTQTSAALERGKKSVLTFKVKLIDVTTGDDTITLQGDLAPWDYKGESKVTIE